MHMSVSKLTVMVKDREAWRAAVHGLQRLKNSDKRMTLGTAVLWQGSVLLALCDCMDCSLPDSVQGIFQARILEWVATPFSKGSSQLRDGTQVSFVSCTAGRFFIHEAIEQLSL